MIETMTPPKHMSRASQRYAVMQLEKGVFSVMDMQNPVGEPWNPLIQYDDAESAEGYARQCEFHWWFPMTQPPGVWTYVNGMGGYAWKMD